MFFTFTVAIDREAGATEYERVAFNTDHILSIGPALAPRPIGLTVLKLVNGKSCFVVGDYESLIEKINKALK